MSDEATPVHVAANADGICWSCAPAPHPLRAFRRAASFRAAATAAREAGPQTAPGTLAAIAAAQIERDRRPDSYVRTSVVSFLDRRTLRTTRHRVTVHPYDGPASPRPPELTGLPLTRDELGERWQRVSDARFGAFAELADSEVSQLPLKVALARMSDPCGLLPAPATVAGVGVDARGARERAMLSALATYASTVIDPRLLVDADGGVLGSPENDPSRLLEMVRDGAPAFVRAIDLSDGTERLVPARQAYPVLTTQGPFRAPCGASAALDAQLALTDGLLQHCVQLTVDGVSLAAGPLTVLAAEDFNHDPAVRFLVAMVKAAGLRLTLRDVTGPIEVPVVACASESGATVYGGGGELVDAVREALMAALFHYQLLRDPVLQAAVPAMASPAIWTAPASLNGLSPGQLGPDQLSPDQLTGRLASLGYAPCAFALDHDRAVHDAFPFLLQVTLVPAGASAGVRVGDVLGHG